MSLTSDLFVTNNSTEQTPDGLMDTAAARQTNDLPDNTNVVETLLMLERLESL